MMQFNRKYFFISLGLLIVEILIGSYMHDRFIRPYAGDFLVVILLYCMIRACYNHRAFPVALVVLLFSYLVEWTQYLKLADYFHVRHGSLAGILLGNYFSWTDMLCYTLGISVVLVLESLHPGTRARV